jgi:hypothetical protein
MGIRRFKFKLGVKETRFLAGSLSIIFLHSGRLRDLLTVPYLSCKNGRR